LSIYTTTAAAAAAAVHNLPFSTLCVQAHCLCCAARKQALLRLQ